MPRSVFTSSGLGWAASLPVAPAARIGDLVVVLGQVPLDDEMNLGESGALLEQYLGR